MKNFIKILLLTIAISSCNNSSKDFVITDLRTEYMCNPIGVDSDSPRFSWKLDKGNQSSYQIVVGIDSIAVSNGEGKVWNSDKVESDDILVDYAGNDLEGITKYYWTVKVWNENNIESNFADIASFETGMKDIAWQAKWITDIEDVNEKQAGYFRKQFKINKEIKVARVYLASAGMHELQVNNAKIGDAEMNPIYTRFDKRVLYNTYDVTSLLRKDNTIDVVLGNGWYNHQSTAVWDFHKAHWRARPRFVLELFISYADGSNEVIKSDETWKTSFGKIQFNSIYTAEHVDNNIQYNWGKVLVVDSPTEIITSQVMPPIRKVNSILAVSFRKINDTTYLYNFGKNMSGITELKVQGEKGTVISVRHAERLSEDKKSLDLTALLVHYRPTDSTDPFQEDIYTLSGEGQETFSPKFNYKGFQYVELITSKPMQIDENSLVAYFMHSDVKPVGEIDSSNELLTKIWKATNRAYLSNLFGYPTDCPQREKNGWTGDGHIAVETGLYNFDGIKIYEKWMDDHRDEQQADGTLPAIIPTDGWGYTWANGPDWTSSMVIVPWNVYKFYGDKRILEENIENMKLYVNKISSVAKNNLTDWGLGDWVPIKTKSNVEFTSSIFYYTDALIVSKTAELLGKTTEAIEFKILAETIKEAINDKYFQADKNIYASGTQTEMSMALFRGIVPENKKQVIADNLAKSVQANGMDVGLLGSKSLLNALSENGYADLAYKITSNKEFPSWGYWIENGATTLYENWDLNAKNDMSLNHIMFGEIGAWYYKALGGINIDENNPGFKNIILKPNFVKGLKDIKVKHNGPYGEIISQWRKVDGKVEYKIVIPPNSTATLILPNRYEQGLSEFKISEDNGMVSVELSTGTYRFNFS